MNEDKHAEREKKKEINGSWGYPTEHWLEALVWNITTGLALLVLVGGMVAYAIVMIRQ